MRNIKLTIEYDGTAYCGWQVQPNGASVQAVLKRAVEKMAGHSVNLIVAGRTDAGVHALGQVANFRTHSRIPCDGFLKGLNSMLPEDISIRAAEDVPDDFHAKKSARGKHYRYLVAFGGSRPALLRDRVWYVGAQYVAQDFSPANVSRSSATTTLADKKDLRYDDIAKNINKSAQSLVGVHDFSAFCGSGDCNRSKVREIYSIKVHVIPTPIMVKGEESCALLAIDIKGKSFLKHMVRNIVGTLIRPRGGEGSNSIFKPRGQTPSSLSPMIPTVLRRWWERGLTPSKILGGRDRRKAGVTAPACGLYLVEVFY